MKSYRIHFKWDNKPMCQVIGGVDINEDRPIRTVIWENVSCKDCFKWRMKWLQKYGKRDREDQDFLGPNEW